MLKSCFNNAEPKLLNYIDFKHFSPGNFKEDLSEALCDCGARMMIVITFLHQS